MLSQALTTNDALNLLVASLLYVAVYGCSFRWLLPRLAPGFRAYANLLLALQLAVTAIALLVQPDSAYDQWLWHLTGGEEWNIPSQVGTTQLALVVGAAWLAAWLARAQPAWKRLHLLLTGGVVAVFLLDEQFQIHEGMRDIFYAHLTLGALLTVATVAAAMRSPKAERIWHGCLIAGLAASALGAIVLDSNQQICNIFGMYTGCPRLSLVEETLELLGIWIAFVAVLGLFQHSVPAPSVAVRRALYALPALWALVIIAFALYPRLELRWHAQPAALEFKSGILIEGYAIEASQDATHLRLYASARQADYIGAGYSIHLVDQASGSSIASQDAWAHRHQSLWYFGRDYEPLYRQTMAVARPPQAPDNRALWVVLSLWRKKWDGSYPPLQLVSSDRQQLSDTQVVLGELVYRDLAAAPETIPLAVFANGFQLQSVDMPATAASGAKQDIAFHWRATADGKQDYTQFLHFAHADSGSTWGYDQPPLGRRLPTRLWYAGMADSQTWQVDLPNDLAPGRYTVYSGLYRQSDLQRLQVSDASGNPFDDMRFPIGSLMINARNDKETG